MANEMSEKIVLGGGVFFQTAYMTYLNDIVAALLCSQIHYWYSASKNGNSKLRVLKQGQFWIAKSRREWGEETGLTDAQVKRGLNVLVQKNVIEKMVTLFNGSPTVHIRAMRVKGKVLKTGEYLIPVVVGAESPVQEANPLVTDAPFLAPQHQPLVTDDQSITESTQQNNQENTQYSLASDDADTYDVEKPKQQPEEKEYCKDVSKVDVEKKNASGYSPDQSTAISPHEVWNQLAAQHAKDYGEFLPLDKKELGQLKLFSERLGNRTEPVLRFVFARWTRFGKNAGATYGAYPVPDVPIIGFLLKYAQAALNYWKEESAPKGVVVAAGNKSSGPTKPAAENIVPNACQSSSGGQVDSYPTGDTVESASAVVEDSPITYEALLAMRQFRKKSEKPTQNASN